MAISEAAPGFFPNPPLHNTFLHNIQNSPYTLSEVTSSRVLSRQQYTRHPPSLSLRVFFIAFSYFSSIRLSRFQIHRHKSFRLLCTYLCKSPNLAFTLLNRITNIIKKVNNRKLITIIQTTASTSIDIQHGRPNP